MQLYYISIFIGMGVLLGCL